MTDTELKNKLRQSYEWDEWKSILDFLFAKIDYFTVPSEITTTKEKVRHLRQMGIIKLADGKNLAVFEVEVVPQTEILRNRVELRNVTATYIDLERFHGALVFYHAIGKDDYRLTFIAKQAQLSESGELLKSQTHPKRYTYVLGRNEACTTATRRLLELRKSRDFLKLDDVTEAFSVERLNKEFFDKYKRHYERFSKFIAESDYRKTVFKIGAAEDPEKIVELEKPIRDFAKKLLGRIVFLHFLQKKGWLGVPSNSQKWEGGDPEFMQNLFSQFEPKKNFHSKCLTELFFATLNTKRRDDIFAITRSRVPYLNGGLFDDDFHAAWKMDFPLEYFKELFEFFQQYNFTIDENDPDDNEVGIDPEMLGHIFENLLEENREKGAFYTPKEIVHYMCQESLIQYLQTYLGKHEAIEDFILTGNIGDKKDKNNFIVKNAKQIEERLDDVKICDPAIGSGAFPMGLLQEILKAKTSLDLTLDRARAKKDIIQNSIYGVDIDNGAVDIARLRFWLALVVDEDEPHPLPNLDYKIMQGNSLLENYEGVDLSNLSDMENEAFFISAKRVQYELGSELSIKEPTLLLFDERSKKELYNLINAYFDFEERAYKRYPSKQFIKDEINKIVEGKLLAKFVLQKPQIERQIAEKRKQIVANKIKGKDSDGIKRKKEKNTEKLKRELATRQKEFEHLNDIITHLDDLQDSVDKPYFLWHLWFKSVFDRGGFDIVIGNPPYRQLQKMRKEADVLERAGYTTFTRTGDVYCLFYEQGNTLLKGNGVLTYITSNSWMKTQYGGLLRKYFVEHMNPLKLLNFEDTKIFQAVTVEANILVAQKATFTNSLQAVAIRPDYRIGLPIINYFKANSLELNDLDSEGWTILSKQDDEIKKQVDKAGKPLRDFHITINFGIKTGCNEAFIINGETKQLLIENDGKSAELMKPLLRGKDISKYYPEFKDYWLLFIPWHFPLHFQKDVSGPSEKAEKLFTKRYPAVYNHLKKYQKQLSSRNQAEVSVRYEWYALQRWGANYWADFEKPKIIWGEISDKPKFALDLQGYFTNDRCSFIVGDKLKFLVSLLNSRLIQWYFNQISTTSGMGTIMWKHYKIEMLPIPEVNDGSLLLKFETIVDYLTYLYDVTKAQINPYTENGKLAPVFEDVLNMMVYELYFGDHMKDEDIDVLRFIDTENVFKDISAIENEEEKKSIIGKAYSKLQEQDNPIRNRIISSNIKSPHLIRRINSTTH
jgi:tRNA1(Val) A37 N6-methylase TrmN6